MVATLPKGLTRGYSNLFLDALNRVPEHKFHALTRAELDALDIEDVPGNTLVSGHDAP